ncbi:MAG: peptide deformylase [Clostridia bacterium]|nr:peptide deformylase [Clostridia bacterium]
MVKEIMRDVMFLSRKSVRATDCPKDRQTAQDLLDTLAANKERCVGMAANMIGESKCIIAVTVGFFNIIMYNPLIKSKKGIFETEEGCLSLDGVRKTTRFEEIEVEYEDINFMKQRKRFSGFTAQIIQHEVDHLNGIII